MTNPVLPPTRIERGDNVSTPTKSPFASTGWWGSLATIITFGFAWLVRTHRLPAEIEEPVRSLSLDIIAGILAGAVAMYGRWHANQPLSLGTERKAAVVKSLLPFILFVPLLSGCANLSVPADWVKAERKTYDAIAPEYVDYVAADARLSALQKANRQNDVKSWESRIVEHEKATAAKAGGQ